LGGVKDLSDERWVWEEVDKEKKNKKPLSWKIQGLGRKVRNAKKCLSRRQDSSGEGQLFHKQLKKRKREKLTNRKGRLKPIARKKPD